MRTIVNAIAAVALSWAGLPSLPAAAQPTTNTWSGILPDESLRKLAPAAGYVADARSWSRLWAAWRPDEKLPRLDFSKQLVLVGTVPGPNNVLLRPMMDSKGALRFIVGGTRKAGPGFGYKLLAIGRTGVKTINGNPLSGAAATEDSIQVTVVGTLRTGMMAIGGETTGVTITSKGITWELDLGRRGPLRKTADKLNGQKVKLRGSLERRRGVEIKQRWIVTVASLQAVAAADD
jgi:hypothetical protein